MSKKLSQPHVKDFRLDSVMVSYKPHKDGKEESTNHHYPADYCDKPFHGYKL